jgi:hypothetical protein
LSVDNPVLSVDKFVLSADKNPVIGG